MPGKALPGAAGPSWAPDPRRGAAATAARRETGTTSLEGTSQRFYGIQWRLLYSHVAVALGAAAVGALAVGLAAYAGRSFWVAASFASLALLAAAIGGMAVAVRSSRLLKLRLREASRFASALARGDYRWRIVTEQRQRGGIDEIDQLKEELNAMADSLEAAIGDLRALADRNQRLAEEAGRLAALEERTRLARDLHDTVNQQVFSLAMQAAAARRKLEQMGGGANGGDGRGASGGVGALLAEVEELARSAHRQMRDLILELRPTTLEQQGLGPALREYVRTFAEGAGLEGVCHIDCTGRFGLSTEEALFRIAQEALNNVAKHSGAKRVEVCLCLDESRNVSLAISDDGRGFDPVKPVRATALGLRGLKERAGALGGQVRVMSAPGRGTTVIATFPVKVVGGAPAAAGPAN